MSKRDVALQFVHAFCSGDIAGVEATLAENFALKGPLFEFSNRSDYIASLHEGGLESAASEILGIVEDTDTLAVFYAYKKAESTVNIAQLFWFTGRLISRTLLVFDSSKK